MQAEGDHDRAYIGSLIGESLRKIEIRNDKIRYQAEAGSGFLFSGSGSRGVKKAKPGIKQGRIMEARQIFICHMRLKDGIEGKRSDIAMEKRLPTAGRPTEVFEEADLLSAIGLDGLPVRGES